MTTGTTEHRLRQFLPTLSLALAALVDLAPIPDAAPASRGPDILIAALFFWSLHRAELVAPIPLFALGLATDFVAGSMIGLTPALLLLTREAVVRQHKLLLAMSWPVLTASFASYAAALGFLRWVMASLMAGRWYHPIPAVLGVLLTVLAWPFVVLLLMRLQTALPRMRHAAGS
ncbi:MAG TPA: rod shape-determining protein MreD [Geminicoccus sp.]|jgi:rod shape-determining protein MreD|uniref:rod shape-determining protein MreD n=1 Tax=Geminicoccus sp. TaxID=2024832 RepID=UPI002E378F3D|nr:rod shape-determining protein MreD [Geminicoccus sp.]HEX2527260.1 rod shape-determining protein MreD [Geminicoccus sp.]